ncbi:MAG: flagellar basal-body rod protein FlgF [Acidobacteriia bacterium]|nr:flagellar basal-body rod protein FlgF [Terriglobia bacterium]
MDPLTISAAGGMRSRMESLDMLANNIANTSTGGYKADREFYSLYAAPEAAGAISGPDTLPVIERPWTDFSQGELRPTGNPLDLALAGKGFFSVNGADGPLYTRDGSFRVSAAGQLVTADGYAVRGVDGDPIALSSASPVEISPDGTVLQDGQTTGQLAIVDFANPAVLRKQGHNYFQPAADGSAVPAAGYAVQQGKLENSNASSAEAAVRLVSVMRQFEMLQKAAALGGEMNRKAVEEVARVS